MILYVPLLPTCEPLLNFFLDPHLSFDSSNDVHDDWLKLRLIMQIEGNSQGGAAG